MEPLARTGIAHLGPSALQPALQRRRRQQGVAACAGDLTASSPCPTERLSLRCCPHVLMDTGSLLGKTPG